MIHFIAGMIFAVAFLVRIYWAFVGNHSSRAIFIPPVWNGSWWRGLFDQMAYYLFLKKESELWVGHNPLAQIAMFAMYTLGTLFIIVTGFALYAEQWGWGTTPMNLMGWVFVLFGDPQQVRTLHHLAMWYLRAVRGHPHLHGVPRGHHERRVRHRHDDQRHPDVEAGTEELSRGARLPRRVGGRRRSRRPAGRASRPRRASRRIRASSSRRGT